MNPHRDHYGDEPHRDGRQAARTIPYGLALLEVVVATTVVVGFFGAASQPMSWASVVQLLLCASLGILLWLADARLGTDESVAAESEGAHQFGQPTRRETSSSY
jgi:hypothetical protein